MGSLSHDVSKNEAGMLLRTDSDRKWVEEPQALILDVGIEVVSAETSFLYKRSLTVQIRARSNSKQNER